MGGRRCVEAGLVGSLHLSGGEKPMGMDELMDGGGYVDTSVVDKRTVAAATRLVLAGSLGEGTEERRRSDRKQRERRRAAGGGRIRLSERSRWPMVSRV